MKKLRLYLDTSVLNFLFAEDVPEFKKITEEFFENYVKKGKYITIDILVSWNFKHLANIQKQIAVRIVNEKEGYFYPLLLTNPMEVIYENN